MHFKSALPLSAKTNYIRNEIKQIHNRCIEEKDKITHTAHFINILRNNDYLTSITQHLNNNESQKLHRPSNTCFLKLPHFSEIITKEIHGAIYKEGQDMQLAHSGLSLRQYITKKNNNTITTCTLAHCPIRDPNICQKTYTIYRLICLKCHNLYIESTIRPATSELKKHLNTRASLFHKHFIIMSCRKHGYLWPSLATFPYRSSPLAGLQSYIPYPHIAAVYMFKLVILLLLGHMWGSIGVHHLWPRLCFSSSVLHVWFV